MDHLAFGLFVCFQGGSGWWKYEFCYGKQVMQFHQEVCNMYDPKHSEETWKCYFSVFRTNSLTCDHAFPRCITKRELKPDRRLLQIL